MAVAYDAGSRPASTSASVSSFSWTHTPVGTPRGVLVFVYNMDNASGDVTSVTYGGVTVPAVSGGVASDSAGEPGRTSAFFLSSGIPTGAQTVVVNRNNNANVMDAVAITVTAGGNTAVHEAGIVLIQGDGTVAQQSVTDGSPGTNSVRFAGGFFGHQNPPTAGADSTEVFTRDIGAQANVTVRETTAGQGARNVGMSSGTSDDQAIVHLAVKEITDVPRTPAAGTLTLTGTVASLALAMGLSAGALGLTGYAPTAQFAFTIPPDAGAVSLTGHAPAVSVETRLTADAASLTLTGTAPSLATGASVAVGSLTLSGQAPDLLTAYRITPDTGALVLTGQAPSASQTVNVAPDAGALAFTGLAPTVTTTEHQTRDIPAGTLTLAGYAPTLSGQFQVAPAAGALTLSGQAPAVALDERRLLDAGVLALQGYAPTLAIRILVQAGTLALTGLAPTVVANQPVEVGSGVLTLAGHVPAIAWTLPVSAGALTLSGYAPTVDVISSQFAPAAAALVLTGHAPTVTIATIVSIELLGSYARTVALTGSFVQSVTLTGSRQSSLTLTGSVED